MRFTAREIALPVCSVADGAFFLGEVLSLGQLLGGAVVIGGLALITFERRPPIAVV
ncbi:MAG: hypothetical protein WBO29_00580 [Albidovulum sp.]